MSQSSQEFSFEGLSVAERIILVERIWDSIAKDQEAPEVTPELRAELTRRLEAHRANPDRASSWEEVKARLQNKI